MLKELCKERGLMPVWEDTAKDWNLRRSEIIQILCDEEYGSVPDSFEKVLFEVQKEEPDFCAGKATLREVKITTVFQEKTFSFPVYASLPNTDEKHPFFIFINFRPDVPDRYLPVEELIDRGFAVISFCYHDVTVDDGAAMPKGGINPEDLHELLFADTEKAPHHSGKIALWAFAASRAMDYAETLDCLDFNRAAVIGHSRLGKTALLAGILDERFTHVISNDSGCSGAAVTRLKKGERIADITSRFPHWFCENYQNYAGREEALPFDQHFLLAAAAPRKVYVASAAKDEWADPDSEYLSCFAASEVYEKLGLPGFISPDRLPKAGEGFQEGTIGYHLRKGSHYLSREDWNHYMDFLSR